MEGLLKKIGRAPGVLFSSAIRRGLSVAAAAALATAPAAGDEAQWIWADSAEDGQPIPEGQTCLFRKPINLRVAARGSVEIAADDRYDLYVNGHRVGSGESAREMQQYDISEHLEVGRNVVAVRATNTHGETAAMAARVSIQPENAEKWFTFSTDSSWLTSLREPSLWHTVVFNDRLWGSAHAFGRLGETSPWDRDEDVAVATETEQKERFQIQKGFGVARVLEDQQVGSVIAMSFNEFGHLIVSQERGPLLLVFDRDEDGVPEQVRTYCDQVESCQGILPLNGDVFVTGDGPEGWALYRLSDADRNGTLEEVQTVLEFDGSAGEHGPHGLRLGPDGMIYVALGSHVQATGKVGDGQTLRDSYEGDLLPRYADPGGHARGVKAPGGTIIRTNPEGTVVERVAGGLRNVYDVMFHPDGSLLVHDADMEADVGTPWYRPTALFDVTEGGEFGWRTGWAKWPEHYFDRLPTLLDTGRGSPTGGVCYDHHMFPVRYHQSLFLGDWSEGRILNVRLKPRGAGYTADSEVFLQGQPLNVTDLAVGPDGALYFGTGGRGTGGGIYRVFYQGEIPARMQKLGTGIAAAIRQPQLESAWSRQKIAAVKREIGDKWASQVAGVAYSNDNPPDYRVRAMDLMQLFGPLPSEDLVLELSRAPSEPVRARAADLLGLHPGERGAARLVEMLSDRDARVQRAAGEAILRSGQLPADPEPVLELLDEDDRTLVFVARRILERMPTEQWRDRVLESSETRVALVGMLALINAEPTESTAIEVLARISEMMTGFLSDADFVDTLRLCQVALHRGEVDPSRVEPLRDQIAEEFPAGDPRMNHELIRLAAYLKADSIADRALAYLESDASSEGKTLVAMCLPFLSHQWSDRERFQILKYYENAAGAANTGSLSMYLMNVTRNFAETLSQEDVEAILEQGAAWRNAALAAIYRLPRPIDEATAAQLRELDTKLMADPQTDDVTRRLRTGILAMLATCGDEPSLSHLRKIWRNEPQRRAMVAMAISNYPDGENWDYLVRSLNILDDDAAREVVSALCNVPVATDDPMALRQLILVGLRAEAASRDSQPVERLLAHWTGTSTEQLAGASSPADDDDGAMSLWQAWYADAYPDRPAAELPEPDQSRWDLHQLVDFLESDQGRFGNPEHGRELFDRAQCAECHRFGEVGEAIGPDLTSIARRFTRQEILESILYPGHIVSDQYASNKVLTLDGRSHVGLVSQRGDGTLVIRDAQNQVTELAESDVDQILPSTTSVMPSGLLDDLTLREISDLMSFLGAIPPLEIAAQPER